MNGRKADIEKLGKSPYPTRKGATGGKKGFKRREGEKIGEKGLLARSRDHYKRKNASDALSA